MDRLTIAKQAIGIFSIGLGLAAVIAPRRFAAAVGLDKSPEKVAAFGARELGAGAALLSPVKPSPFLWTRVLGDAFDLWGLATAFRTAGSKRTVLGIATVSVVAITVLDIVVAIEATRERR